MTWADHQRVAFELAQRLGPQLLADAAKVAGQRRILTGGAGCVCTKGQLPPPARPYTQRMFVTPRSITSSGNES